MNEELEEVRRIISEADPKSVVFFGGAGVSTESGIPDFRSAKGIFNEAYPYPPEVIVGHSFFEAHPMSFTIFTEQRWCMKMPNRIRRTRSSPNLSSKASFVV